MPVAHNSQLMLCCGAYQAAALDAPACARQTHGTVKHISRAPCAVSATHECVLNSLRLSRHCDSALTHMQTLGIEHTPLNPSSLTPTLTPSAGYIYLGVQCCLFPCQSPGSTPSAATACADTFRQGQPDGKAPHTATWLVTCRVRSQQVQHAHDATPQHCAAQQHRFGEHTRDATPPEAVFTAAV